MPKRKGYTTRKLKTTRKRSKKPIGYTKKGKSYALVYGSKKKPKLGKGRYKTKKTLAKALLSGKAR